MSTQGFSFPPPPPPPPVSQQHSGYSAQNANKHWSGRGAGGGRGRGRGHGNRGRGGHHQDTTRPPYQNMNGYNSAPGNFGFPAQPIPATSYMPPSPYPHSQANYQPSPNPPAYPSTQPFSQPAGSAPFHQPITGYNGPANLAHPTPFTTQNAPTYPPQVPTPQHGASTNAPVIMDSMYWTAEAHSSYATPPSGYGHGHGHGNGNGHAGRGHRGSQPHGNHGLKPRHPNKRDHGAAFNKPTSTVPKVPAPPSVPSFGNPLPCKPPPAADATRKPKKRKRKHNQLGLTPKTEDHESSEEEDDGEVDEEAKLAAGGTDNGPLQFTYRGRTAVLQSASDIAAWIEERKKKFPTQARIEEKKNAAEEAKAARETARREREQAKYNEKEKQKAPTELGHKLSDSHTPGDPAIDAAKKAQRKADKIRRTLDREQKRFAKAEAEAEAARLKVEALRKQVLGLKDDEQDNGVSTEQLEVPNGISASLDRGDDLVMAGATEVTEPAKDQAAISITNSGTGDLAVASVAPDKQEDAMDTISDVSESDWTSSSGSDLGSDSDSGSDGSAPEEVSSRREGPERVAPPPREGKKTVCRHFARNGQCNRGDKCKFSHEVPERGAKPKPPTIDKKGRKGLFQALLEQQKTEEDKRAMEVISWLGQHGMLEANSQANGAPQPAPV